MHMLVYTHISKRERESPLICQIPLIVAIEEDGKDGKDGKVGKEKEKQPTFSL